MGGVDIANVILHNLQIPRNREARQYNGRIIECYWDQKTGWNFMRVREDKSHPNGYTTAKSEPLYYTVNTCSHCYTVVGLDHAICRCVSEYSSASD